jgi:hypothetical protein
MVVVPSVARAIAKAVSCINRMESPFPGSSLYTDKDSRIKDLSVRKYDAEQRSTRARPGEGHKPESRGFDFERDVHDVQVTRAIESASPLERSLRSLLPVNRSWYRLGRRDSEDIAPVLFVKFKQIYGASMNEVMRVEAIGKQRRCESCCQVTLRGILGKTTLRVLRNANVTDAGFLDFTDVQELGFTLEKAARFLLSPSVSCVPPCMAESI